MLSLMLQLVFLCTKCIDISQFVYVMVFNGQMMNDVKS